LPARKSTRERTSQPSGVRVPIPPSRDPFVNTPLLSLGTDARGVERFWISTWNTIVGCQGLLIDELGAQRVYRFGKEHPGFYSACREDPDTLWLCGWLDQVVRLKLSSGKFDVFPTGAPRALVFQGMRLDATSGKLFAAAFPSPQIAAFSFDIRARKTAKLFADFSSDHYMRHSFPNGDGTYSFVLHIPGESLLRWDPCAETLSSFRVNDALDVYAPGGSTYFMIADERGRRYFPKLGWFDPATRRFEPAAPPPKKEQTWFARCDNLAYGVETAGTNVAVSTWDLATGEVASCVTIPDSSIFNVNLSASKKIVAVNIYGVFQRYDASSRALECARVMPTAAIGKVDCLVRIDKERLLGTPFITQRFWELNLRTRKGLDCGRAAPGSGEIMKTWFVRGKVYMAAYTGGELMEYDPRAPICFPENPRVVADPPGGMRPVGAAEDGRNIFYACSAPYGKLGSVLTRYDTQTGRAAYVRDPLPDLQLRQLGYERATRKLLAAASLHADCESRPPKATRSQLARFDADTLAVEATLEAPEGAEWACVDGPLARGRWLVHFDGGAQRGGLKGPRFWSLQLDPLKLLEAWTEPPGLRRIVSAGKSGLFVLQLGTRVELWDVARNRALKVLHKNYYGYHIEVQDRALYLVCDKEIIILEKIF
jgi:hypothetical protein